MEYGLNNIIKKQFCLRCFLDRRIWDRIIVSSYETSDIRQWCVKVCVYDEICYGSLCVDMCVDPERVCPCVCWR